MLAAIVELIDTLDGLPRGGRHFEGAAGPSKEGTQKDAGFAG